MTVLASFFAPRPADERVRERKILARAEMKIQDVHVEHALEFAREMGGDPDKALERYASLAGLIRPMSTMVVNRALARLEEYVPATT